MAYKNKDDQKAWMINHPGYAKTRYAANPEKYRAYSKAFRDRNPEIHKAQSKAWRALNPSKVKAYQEIYSLRYYMARSLGVSIKSIPVRLCHLQKRLNQLKKQNEKR